uniref:Uncharacterized protein n=1 Tax=viral metagenome TaxID=1070528 RepID=A0A6C0BB83_9ZZZZ
MENIDLNIDNYQYQELLSIFQVSENIEENDYNKIKKKLYEIKSSFSEEIYNFYWKAHIIIMTIQYLMKQKKVDNAYKNSNIHFYVEKIKSIPHFEERDIDALVNVISNQQISEENEEEKQNKVLNSNTSIIDKQYLNEKYQNVISRDPSLNNRNNTNTITDTLPNEVGPGFLNSIKRITQLQNLNLNSCFRTNYFQSNPCDFLYLLPVEVKNVLSMRLASIEIPNAWYLFSNLQKNNRCKIDVTNNGVKTSYEICIADGNYDNESLQNYLNTTYFCDSPTETDLQYLKFTIESANCKSCFSKIDEAPDSMTFSLLFLEDLNQNVMTTLGWILGYRLPNYLAIREKIRSEGLFDGGGDRYIYVAINDYQYNSNSSNLVTFDKNILNEDIIAKIPMINGKLCLIIDESNNALTKTRKYNGPVNIARLNIKILDKFGNIIDLNCMDYSLTIEMEILYESFNFKNVTY